MLLDLTQVPSRVAAHYALLDTTQLLVTPHAHLVYLARYLRSARPLAPHVLPDLTRVPSRVTAHCALLVTTQPWVPLALSVRLVATLLSQDLQLALHALLANSLALEHSPVPCALPDSQSCRGVSRHHVWPSPTAI